MIRPVLAAETKPPVGFEALEFAFSLAPLGRSTRGVTAGATVAKPEKKS